MSVLCNRKPLVFYKNFLTGPHDNLIHKTNKPAPYSSVNNVGKNMQNWSMSTLYSLENLTQQLG